MSEPLTRREERVLYGLITEVSLRAWVLRQTDSRTARCTYDGAVNAALAGIGPLLGVTIPHSTFHSTVLDFSLANNVPTTVDLTYRWLVGGAK
jgi:hypothetical protein